MPVKRILDLPDSRVHVKIWTDDVEHDALEQLAQTAALPFIHHHVAAMADCHWGMGSTVGSVIATDGAIIPAAVGVDIGCGMIAQKLNLRADQLPDNLRALRITIESLIPHGRTDDGGANDRGSWGDVPADVAHQWGVLEDDDRWINLNENHADILGKRTKTARHLGTLGTGNHFIELCVDTEGGTWLMLHSGSRGIGNRIGSYFISLAKKEMERYFIHLPNQDLAYLVEDTEVYEDYIHAVSWAQDFAAINRRIMMGRALAAVQGTLGLEVRGDVGAVNCHHNYVARERHYGKTVNVTRKGAVRAGIGDLGIIPGSMGARSFIVRGLGNPESFCSCSHGAGRKMGRNAAKKLFTVADLEAQTAGVECRKDADVIDEAPACYKDIATVMDNQSDLVEIVAEIKQVLWPSGCRARPPLPSQHSRFKTLDHPLPFGGPAYAQCCGGGAGECVGTRPAQFFLYFALSFRIEGDHSTGFRHCKSYSCLLLFRRLSRSGRYRRFVSTCSPETLRPRSGIW